MEDIQKAVELAFEAFKERYGQDAVSYTHLTLPTTSRV